MVVIWSGSARGKIWPFAISLLTWVRADALASTLVAFLFPQQLVVCADLLGDGTLLMVAQPSVKCYESEHLPWAIVGWAFVVGWVVGIPVFVFFFLRTLRKRLGCVLCCLCCAHTGSIRR